MKLYIAEKPSLGRAIADALPKPHQRGEGKYMYVVQRFVIVCPTGYTLRVHPVFDK